MLHYYPLTAYLFIYTAVGCLRRYHSDRLCLLVSGHIWQWLQDI